MKIFRSLAAVLFVFALGLAAHAQESGEVAGLRAKAVKGNGIAQYNLGLAYAQGKGIAADQVEAFVWLSLARENGARGRALDTVIGSLDKTTLEQATQRLAERQTALGFHPPAPTTVRAEPVETPAVVAPPAPGAAIETRATPPRRLPPPRIPPARPCGPNATLWRPRQQSLRRPRRAPWRARAPDQAGGGQ